MTQEPFGPIAPIVRFSDLDDVLERANRLSYRLAAFAFTGSLDRAAVVAEALEAGWIGINNFTPALVEAPICGVTESGLGYEGGPEGLDAYLHTKFVSKTTP